MSFDLKNLELFKRAAMLGAIGRAGDEMGLSATNASARIQALEESTQTKLFHRTTRSISLTPDGELFLEHSKRILNEVEEAQSALSKNNGKVRGTLRITAPVTFAKTHITPFLPEFHSAHPELSIDLYLSDRLVDIVEQGFDLAFRIGELSVSSLVARKIDDNPIRLVAAPSYLERKGIPSTPGDLEDHVCFALGYQQKWRLSRDGQKISVVEPRAMLSVNVGDAIADWVLSGHGIGLASLWHAGPDLRAGRLLPVLPSYCSVPEMKIWAVRPPGRVTPLRQRVFLEFMQERIRATNIERYGDVFPSLFSRTSG